MKAFFFFGSIEQYCHKECTSELGKCNRVFGRHNREEWCICIQMTSSEHSVTSRRTSFAPYTRACPCSFVSEPFTSRPFQPSKLLRNCPNRFCVWFWSLPVWWCWVWIFFWLSFRKESCCEQTWRWFFMSLQVWLCLWKRGGFFSWRRYQGIFGKTTF